MAYLLPQLCETLSHLPVMNAFLLSTGRRLALC